MVGEKERGKDGRREGRNEDGEGREEEEEDGEGRGGEEEREKGGRNKGRRAMRMGKEGRRMEGEGRRVEGRGGEEGEARERLGCYFSPSGACFPASQTEIRFVQAKTGLNRLDWFHFQVYTCKTGNVLCTIIIL